MLKQFAFFFTFMTFFAVMSQDGSLPADLRQHALTEYNSSLFNPTFSLDRNNPQSVSFWTRWQWQNIDADPTTLFLNYTRKIGSNSAVGVGFFQQNTGVFFDTGGVVNYAYEIKFNSLVKLSFGANLFGFTQKLADDRFTVNPIPGIPQPTISNDFILQFAPGINLSFENLSFSLASENLFDYNITDKESNTVASDKIFMGMVSYDFPVLASDATAFLRPSLYIRTIPEQQNQVGTNVLFSTKKYWAQTGYNNFYGISVGAGGTILNKFSLGALVEFGTSGSVNNRNPSFEIIASYFLGNPSKRRESVAYNLGNENTIPVDEQNTEDGIKPETTQTIVDSLKKEQEKQNKKEAKVLAAEEKAIQKEIRKDSLATIKKEKEAVVIARKQEAEQDKISKKKLENDRVEQQRIESAQNEKDIEARKVEIELAAQKRKEQKRLDSINTVRAFQNEAIAIKKEAEELVKKKATQELAAKQVEEKVEVQAGEKYQEVTNEDGLEPGFYLIANVFGTKKYFEAFMNDLRKKGIEPKSFYRSQNKYNYAYLERYNTIGEARRGRDSKFNGKYKENTWIFRIK